MSNQRLVSRQQNCSSWTWERKTLLLFVLLFLLKGTFYNLFAIPSHLGTTPDDVGHFSYVIQLYLEHDIPRWSGEKMEQTASRNNEDAFYGTLKADETYQLNLNDYFHENSSANNWISSHPPLYYLYLLPFLSVTALFTTQLSHILIVFRFATTLLGLGTLLCLWGVLRATKTGKIGSCCVMIAYVFYHSIQFTFSSIDNDAMAVFTASLAFCFFVRYLSDRRVRDLCAFAVAAALIYYSKTSALIVLPVYALVFLVDEIFVRRTNFFQMLGRGILCLALFALVCWPLAAQNMDRYGNLTNKTIPGIPLAQLVFPFSGRASAGAALAEAVAEAEAQPSPLMLLLTRNHYLDSLARALISVNGWRGQTRAEMPELIAVAAMLWLACAYAGGALAATLKGRRIWKILLFALLALVPIVGAWVGSSLLENAFVSCLWFASALWLVPVSMVLAARRKQGMILRTCVLSALAVFFYFGFVVYIYHLSHAGGTMIVGMMGRYYYSVIVPLLWGIFHGLGEGSGEAGGRWTRLLPALLLVGCCFVEIRLLAQGVVIW